jgi:hypothetical protein
MASIVKRKNRYSVVYTYKETNIKNGKPLIQTQTLKREKLKLSLNSKAVHSSFLMLRQLRICLKNTAPCTE